VSAKPFLMFSAFALLSACSRAGSEAPSPKAAVDMRAPADDASARFWNTQSPPSRVKPLNSL